MSTAPPQDHATAPAAQTGCCAAHAHGTIPGDAQCREQPLARGDGLVHHYPLVDELLEARRVVFGGHDAVFAGYRGHAYRMLNYARQWTPPSSDRDDKIAICAVFHDLGAWPNDNLDYLRPSADLAESVFSDGGRG